MDLTEGFSYTGSAQNFERDSYATLAEMKAVKAKKMPNIFIATCEETGKLYIYNKQNEDDEVLGKWREVSSGSSAGGASGGSAGVVAFNVYNSYSQGYDTYTKMMADFASAGGSDFGVYNGDGGRGLDGLLPPNVAGDRAKSATVYVINASNFGKPGCTLITSAYGKTYIGRFTEEATNDNFHDGNISVEWAEVVSSSIPTYNLQSGFGQKMDSDKFYQKLAEEIIKHTDGVFFISATDYYSTNKYLVTYSPYYNYRQPNRWTAYYGNVVLTVSYSEQYRLSWKVYNIPSDAIVPYYTDSLPSYGDNGDTAILVKKYSYDYQQNDNGQTLYAWKLVDGDSIVYTEFQYERSDVSDLFSFDSSTGKLEKIQNKKISSIEDNTLTVYDGLNNTLEFTRSEADNLKASKINETVPTAELYVCKAIPESGSEWIKVSGSGAENNKTSFPINFINYYHNGKIGEIDRNLVDPQCYRDYESFDLFALAIKKELTKVKYNLLRPKGTGGNSVEEINSVKRYTGDTYDIEGQTVMADNDFNYKKYLRIEFNGSYYVVINTEEKSIAGFYGSFAIAREEASSCECEEETAVVDFSTWPEYTSGVEANGAVLDGNGGLIIDNSNIGVDPEDIEPDD